MNEAARILVHLIFFYTCIEGLIINVWYPAKLPFLFKDCALLILYVLVFLPNLQKLFAPSPTVKQLSLPLLFFSGIIGFYLLLPGVHGLGAVLAVKQKLFYLPLISIGYLFTRSHDDLKRFFLVVMLCGMGVAAFGIYLYFTGPEGLKRMGAGYSAVLWTPRYEPTVQQSWRVPGTFTSSGQYGAYLLFHGLVSAALLIDGLLSKAWKRIAALSLAGCILAVLASGTRAPLLLLSVAVALLALWLKKIKGAIAWVMTSYVLLATGFMLLGQAVEDRLASIATYEHVTRFRTTYFGQLFFPALLENPMGSGLGIATIGVRHLAESNEIQLIESYFGILALETGFLGFLSFLWVLLAVVVLVQRNQKQIGVSENTFWHALAVYVLLTIAILPISTAIDHAPTNLFFWFSIGVLLRLTDLHGSDVVTNVSHRVVSVFEFPNSTRALRWKPQIR